MLEGLDQSAGAALPPRCDAGLLREIFLAKTGAGFGVPGRCEGYLTVKLGCGLVALPPSGRSARHEEGVPRRGVLKEKGGGLGQCDLAVSAVGC